MDICLHREVDSFVIETLEAGNLMIVNQNCVFLRFLERVCWPNR